MGRKASIYGIKSKTGTVFYIGSTVKNIQERLAEHLRTAANGTHSNPYFARKVHSIGTANIDIIELAKCPEHKRYTTEYKIIQEYDRKGHALTNLLRQGDQALFTRHLSPNRAQSWPEPIDFVLNVYTFVDTKPEQWANHPVVHSLRQLLLQFLHAQFIKPDTQTRLFLRDYLGMSMLADTLRHIRKSPIYNELRNITQTA